MGYNVIYICIKKKSKQIIFATHIFVLLLEKKSVYKCVDEGMKNKLRRQLNSSLIGFWFSSQSHHYMMVYIRSKAPDK